MLARGYAELARIFISHSSTNNAEAVAIRDWLVAEGWDDLFLDLDPTRGIVAGERWERALNQAANRCEAVLFLVSRAWLKSRWCLKEFHLAAKLNKRIFGALIEDLPIEELPPEITAAWQLVDLAAGADHQMFQATLPDGSEAHVTYSAAGLQRLRTGLTKAGIDARFFAWPPEGEPDRPPYRGLRPLEAEDAGIFFGREAPTIEALDQLRGLSEGAPPRFLAILGASGAGKSSFLRAGLLPRLQRDDRHFLPLPVVRPERAAVSGETGLQRSLEAAIKAAGLKKSRAEVKAAIAAGASAVAILLDELAEVTRVPAIGTDTVPPPRLVLPLDQGEELFLSEGAEEAIPFLDLVRELSAGAGSNLLVLVTIRSDAYEQLQSAPSLDGVRQQTLSLPPMPRGAYQTVIEGPAARLRDTAQALTIEPALTAALLADIEAGGAKDALPLLAFTLERLFLEHGGDGDLRLAEYREIGGIRGSIEAAVERALEAAGNDPRMPQDRAAQLALLRRALIPWLAGIDPETGAPRRRVAHLSEVPEEARPLVEHLVTARLLATDVSPDTGERTVEPAHEALLRQWSLLQGWLEEDFAALSTLEGLKRAARDWSANAGDEAWLAHSAGRLEDAVALLRRDDFARSLDATDRAYLETARAVDSARRNRELQEARKLAAAQKEAADAERQVAEKQRLVTRRTRTGLVAASLLAVVAIGAAVFGFEKAREADARTLEAIRNETIGLAALSRIARADGRPVEAVQLALAAWPREGDGERPTLRATTASLAHALGEARTSLALQGHEHGVLIAAFSPDGARVVTASGDGTARVWDAATGAELTVLRGHEREVTAVALSPDGTRVVTASGDKTARVWDAATGAELVVLRGHERAVTSAALSPNGARIVTASFEQTARVWDAATGAELTVLRGHEHEVTLAAFSPDGTRVVTASLDRTARIWDAATGAELSVFHGHEDRIESVAFSPDGARVVTASLDGTARIWDAETGTEFDELLGHESGVTSAVYSPEGSWIVTASLDGTARVWGGLFGTEQAVLRGHGLWLHSATFSPDGTQVVTASGDGTARVWDAATGAELAVLRGHEAEVMAAAFSPDGSQVVTASEDRTARIWDTAVWVEQTVLRGRAAIVTSAAFSPDGTRVVTEPWDGTARIWDAATGVEVAVLHPATSPVFSPDGTLIVTASGDWTGRLWDAATGAEFAVLWGHESTITAAAFSPDGARVVTASRDGTARIWDTATGAEFAVLRGHESTVTAVAFSPDGMRVVTASLDGTARIWDAETGTEFDELLGHESGVTSAVYSPEGSWIVTASHDKTARIWDAATGAELAVLHLAASPLFSPDGSRVVTTSTESYDNAARIWDAATGAEIAVLPGHRREVSFAAFSPGGARVVTASADQTARIWDAATGAELAVLWHQGGVNTAVFSPGGERIVTASIDGSARIWDISRLEQGDGFSVACQRLGNNTDLAAMRKRYNLGELPPICGDSSPLPVDWRALE